MSAGLDEYDAAVASGAWTPRRGLPAPGPHCPACGSLETRLAPSALEWLRCNLCALEWRPESERGEVSLDVVDAIAAEMADRRRANAARS